MLYMTLKRPILGALRMLLAVGLGVTLPGCGSGGSGGGGNAASLPSSGAPAATSSFLTSGPITRFGSMVVGDREFDTTQAEISLGDRVAREDELRLGMRVLVEGIDDDGVPRVRRVVFRHDLEGPIERLDVTNNTLIVLGQTVRVDGLTVIEDGAQPGSMTLSALVVGDLVEISGLADASGVLVATRLERRAGFIVGVTEVEVKGIISRFDGNARSFTLGPLRVDFRSSTVVGALGNGVVVEVRGRQATVAGVFIATRVEVEASTMGGTAGTRVEIEGFVTVVTSSTTFSLNRLTVVITPQSTFENGTAAALVQNIRLVVEGHLDANGALVAQKVSFRQRGGGTVRLIADTDTVDVTAHTVTLLGIVVRIDIHTQFKDDAGGERDFRLERIRLRDRLEIRAFIDAQGHVVATRLRRHGPNTEILLQGPVDSVANPNLVIQGIEVRTDATTECEDSHGRDITVAQFFAAVRSGTIVKARGVLLRGSPVTMRATQVEIEDASQDDDL